MSHGQQLQLGTRHRRAYLRSRAHLDHTAERRKAAGASGTEPPSRYRLGPQRVGRTGRRDARTTRKIGPEAVEQTIEYKDLRGNDQSDPLWQMLQHVVNHGTYHRRQITTMLRQLDAAPPKSMDLIAFYRERNQKA